MSADPRVLTREEVESCAVANAFHRGMSGEELRATCLAIMDRLATAEAERDKAQENYRWMVNKAADRSLDGYRELGAKCAALEAERDAARAERDRLVGFARTMSAALRDSDDEREVVDTVAAFVVPGNDLWLFGELADAIDALVGGGEVKA